ncbi:MAG: hypothetical protein SynsKO_07930 [Synoicihabitans sp.]
MGKELATEGAPIGDLGSTVTVLDASASSHTIPFASETDWSISVEGDWLVVSPLSGSGDGVLTLTSPANPDAVRRHALIRFGTGGHGHIVMQRGALQHYRKVGSQGADYGLRVDAEGDWEVTSDVDWVQVSPNKGNDVEQVGVMVSGNASSSPREAMLTIGDQVHRIIQISPGMRLPEAFVVGLDDFGQLGQGRVFRREVPVALNDDVARVFSGSDHTLILKTDGSLWAMGLNSFGQLGDGTTLFRESPVQVADNVATAAAGGIHSFFVKNDGTLWAMGNYRFRQSGDGSDTIYSTPEQIADGVSTVAAGASHSLFVKTDGTLWALGNNQYGQLGDSTTTRRENPVQIANDVDTAATGDTHSLFIKQDGTLWAMGRNNYGALGDGSTTQRTSPVQVAAEVSFVGAGSHHSLYVKNDGTLWAMGENRTGGQLGDGTTTLRNSPVHVASDVLQVTGGEDHSLFIKQDGTLWAMGGNSTGQLGDGTLVERSLPVWIASGVADIAAGVLATFFVTSDGVLWTSGRDVHDPFAHENSGSGSPVQVAGAVGQVATKRNRSFFIQNNGTLQGMGENREGRLGDGTTINRSVPVTLTDEAISVAAGSSHSLWINKDRELWAVGSNYAGQLGDGTTTSRETPVRVAAEVISVAAGFWHSLFVKSDGTLWGMGFNRYGELGDGTTTERHVPIQVATEVVQVVSGEDHSLFLKRDGTLWAMGRNRNGRLGDGTTINRSSPVQVASGVVAAAGGSYHSLFVKNDGTLWAMGWNSAGQLGDGTTASRESPIQVDNEVVSVAAGHLHSLYIKNDGTLWAMGRNSSGQLGGENFVDQLRPILVAHDVSSVAAGLNHSLWVVDPLAVGSSQSIDIHSSSSDMTAMVGGSARFEVSASGGGPISFQWRKNGVDISGATAASLTIESVTVEDEGIYDVVISGEEGSTTSVMSMLTVSLAPMITRQPQSKAILLGESGALSVSAKGVPLPTYQWRKNGVAISGASGEVYSLDSVTLEDSGDYDVVVTNSEGSVISTGVSVSVVRIVGSHSVRELGYQEGRTITVENTIQHVGTVTELIWSVVPPAAIESGAWRFVASGPGSWEESPDSGDLDLFEWSWSTSEEEDPILFSYTVEVPPNVEGDQSFTAMLQARIEGEFASVLVTPDPLVVPPAPTLHSADTDHNNQIDLGELLRLIELYNHREGTTRTGSYRPDETTVDGFSSGLVEGNLSHHHSADSDRNGAIDLGELLRVIELYNFREGTRRTGQYRIDNNTSDGFAPGLSEEE